MKIIITALFIMAATLAASLGQTEESYIHGQPHPTLENLMQDIILPAAPFLTREVNVLDIFPWLEEMTRLADPNGEGIKFEVQINDPRPIKDRNTMESWRDRQDAPAAWPQIHRITAKEYLIYLTKMVDLSYTITADNVIIKKTE